MKKLLVVVLSLIILVGCNKPQQDDYKLNILSAKGAPSIGIINLIDECNVSTVDGAEVLQASFINPNSEYDVIVAPINLGCKLIQSGKSQYKLYGVITWGNLYIVSNSDSLDLNETLLGFGLGSVPEKIISVVYPNIKMDYYPSVSEVAMNLISKKTNTGLLAEPVCSNVISKRNDLKIIVDLQQEYKKVTGYDNYPQAAIFVRQESYSLHTDVFVKQLDKLTQNNDASIVVEKMKKLEENEAEKDLIGVNSSLITTDSYQRMHIEFKKAEDVKEEVLEFLKLFNITSLDNVMIGE